MTDPALTPGLELAIRCLETQIAGEQAKIDNGQCRNRYQEFEAQAVIRALHAVKIGLVHKRDGRDLRGGRSSMRGAA